VQRDEQVAARLETQRGCRAAPADQVLQRDKAVDHRVADELHALVLDALSAQVLDRLLRVQEAERGEVVGGDAVGLLRHRPVEAAQSRFDVAHSHAKLVGTQRRPEGGVHVARNQDEVRPLLREHGPEPLQNSRDLLGVRAGSHAQDVIGLRHAELLQEDLGHQAVVVLPGVHGRRSPAGKSASQLPDDGSHLDHVGTRTDDAHNSHCGRSLVRRLTGAPTAPRWRRFALRARSRPR
jgi:hypothetical protein